jgi:hypothetical protein
MNTRVPESPIFGGVGEGVLGVCGPIFVSDQYGQDTVDGAAPSSL